MHSHRLFAVSAWLCLYGIFAQDVSPSDDTSPQSAQFPSPGTPQLILKTSQMPMVSQVNLNPLTPDAGYQQSLQTLQNISITGHLVLVTSSNASSIGSGDIAYISCDPSDYRANCAGVSSPCGAAATINIAASLVPKAIVLYSTTSTHCTFNSQDGASGVNYKILYTMSDSNSSLALRNGLMPGASPHASSTIMLDQNSVGNQTGGGGGMGFGPSPSTAVAMIILYSITGVITALFLMIIVIGAVRAHRHPERYGPRNVLGRPRQSRAKGIARAMLETIPIVKFGEKDEPKAGPTSRDIEMGVAGSTNDHSSPKLVASTVLGSESEATEGVREGASNGAADLVTTVTASGAMDAMHSHVDGETNTDNGLACSVCTDDFVKGQNIRVLPCNHKFHPECIDPWLLNVSGTCPLCRVDLRPTTINTDTPTDNIESSEDQPRIPTLITASPTDSAPHPRSDPSPRSRTGLSLYLQHTLNIRRMRDATPEERIAALRRLRTVDRANHESGHHSNEPEQGTGLRVGERTRDRFSARLSRVWRGGPQVGITNGHPISTPVDVGLGDVVRGTEEGESRRNSRMGTFAG